MLMQNNTAVIRKNIALLESRQALKKFTLNVTVKRYTTDPNGTVLDSASIPDSEKHPFAFHLFGEFDRQGGYALANKLSHEYEPSGKLFAVYVHGVSTPLFFFSPWATINNYLKKGDVVFLYVDSISAPNFFTHIVLTSPQAGYASLSSQSNITQLDDYSDGWGVFHTNGFKYSWDNDAQLMHPLFGIRTRFDGAYQYDPFDPKQYRVPENRGDIKTAVIPFEMLLNQYTGITGFLDFNNEYINFSFNLYK